MEREATLVRLQGGQPCCPRDMPHPGTSRGKFAGDVRDRRVRDTEEDDVGIVRAHGDAALA
jgi:hypothetical protein